MTVHELPAPLARRDVKGMVTLLSTLRGGEPLRVTFRDEKYGVFTVAGRAVLSPSVKTFMVGSLFIESSLKPEKAVLAIEKQEDSGEPADDDAETIQTIVDEVHHGDAVAATFEQRPYGHFTVTGVAVETATRDILAVGSWFLAHQAVASPRLRALSVLAAADRHHLQVPAPITTWEDDDPGD